MAAQVDDVGRIWVAPSLYGDEHPTWMHRCSDGAWKYHATPDHAVISLEPLTLSGSLMCHDCGLHGWIREGAWINLP